MDRSSAFGIMLLCTWIAWLCALGMLTGRAAKLATEHVTVPHCQALCREHGAAFDRLRIHTKGGPAEACICGGEALTPAFVKSTTPPTLAAILVTVLGGYAGLFALVRIYGWVEERVSRRP